MDNCGFIVTINSNWIPQADKPLEDAVTVKILDNETIPKVGLDEIVNLDTCVFLVNGKTDSKEPCHINIASANPVHQIMTVTMISQSKMVEFYSGKLEEYVDTYTAKLVDDINGSAVYRIDIVLQAPGMHCKLKLPKTKHQKEIWIYGIHCILKKSAISQRPESSINYSNVNVMLKNINLSENAEKCRAYLEVFGANQRCSSAPLTPVIKDIVETFAQDPVNAVRHCQSARPELNDPSQVKSQSKGDSTDVLANIEEPRMEFSSTELGLRAYIDDKFKELENNVMKKLKVMEERQLNKLDKVLKILEMKNLSTT